MKNHTFTAETKEILELVVHSLYSHQEIFLRELVSNASDAIDKRRLLSLTDTKLAENFSPLIQLECNEKEKTITLRDNGVGMTEEEAIENLGSIAKSGTKAFLKQLKTSDSSAAKMIGQFGVGFYSAFMVADKVVVNTKSVYGGDATQFIATMSGQFSTDKIEKSEAGTEIILHLREDATEYLNAFRLKGIIHKYSEHIAFPIMMPTRDKDVSEEWEQINSATAIWSRAASEVSEEEHNAFYKQISHHFDEPLTWSHNRVEGKLNYTSLLYIPKEAPHDFWQRDRARGLKLYVERVFIMDHAENFLPYYLRFISGVLDTSDLPLNVSREILQDSVATKTIKQAITKRVLGMLEGLANNEPEKYQAFWETFGVVLKEGPHEDYENKDRIAKLLRFVSNQSNKLATVSLEDYLKRMKDGQKHIYYMAADTFEAAQNSPHLEYFEGEGIEVLLLTDKIDEWLIGTLQSFEGTTLRSVAQGELEEKDESKEVKKDEEPTDSNELSGQYFSLLEGRVSKVRISKRLKKSPSCLVADNHGVTAQMARILESVGQNMPNLLPVLEINENHALVKHIQDFENKDEQKRWAEFLLLQAELAEGGALKNPGDFVKQLNLYLEQGLKVEA